MENVSALEELNRKISLFMERYNTLQDENIKLSEELGVAKEKLDLQEKEIASLKEEEELRAMEIEEITQKIEIALS